MQGTSRQTACLISASPEDKGTAKHLSLKQMPLKIELPYSLAGLGLIDTHLEETQMVQSFTG